MSFWDDDCLPVGLDDTEVFDPLHLQRSAPTSDDEAARMLALCEAATSGPLVIDDQAQGEGVVVATLPDGRHVISLTSCQPDDPGMVEANARLICQARRMLLRLLRDRERWQRERKELVERIAVFESDAEAEVHGAARPR